MKDHQQQKNQSQVSDKDLDQLIAQLPREQQPKHDLWPGISLRLTARQKPAVEPQRSWRIPVALAASVLVAIAAVALVLNQEAGQVGAGLDEGSLAGVENQTHPQDVAPEFLAEADYPVAWQVGFGPQNALRYSEIVDLEYASAMHQLRTFAGDSIGATLDRLPAATVAEIEFAMSQFESAAGDIRAALNQDPENMALAQMLSSNQARQLRLLKQVAQMTS